MSHNVIFYFNGTFMRKSNGAHARATAFLHFLQHHFDKVTVYSFREHPTCPWTESDIRDFTTEFPQVSLILDRRSAILKIMTRIKNILSAVLPSYAQMIIRLSVSGAAPGYAALLRQSSSSTLIINYVDGLNQLNGIRQKSFIVETHDVMFIAYRLQNRKPATGIRAVLKFRSEIGLLDTARAIIAISPTEREYFRMLVDRTAILYVPNFGPQQMSQVDDEHEEVFTHDLLFVGSENSLNIDGLTRFLYEHRAWLVKYRIAIYGKVCDNEAVIRAAHQLPYVDLFGFVEDLDQVYRRAKAAMSPVNGTGLKIKVIDALSRGKPVFASPSSIAGLPPGYEGCVFPLEQTVMSNILDSSVLRRVAEQETRTYFADFCKRGDRDDLLSIIKEQEWAAKNPELVPDVWSYDQFGAE